VAGLLYLDDLAGGIVTVRNQTLNQNDEAVQVAVVKMLVPRRPA